MTERWLSILGIGEDGVEGLTEPARALIRGAVLVVGGARHLTLAGPLITGERLEWPSPITEALPRILALRGQSVAVLASGDPFWFGIGAMLAAHVPTAEFTAIPAPSAFALACARLGWTLQSVETISFCGRALAAIAPLLHPGTRILALSADGDTPAALAALLTARGFGASRLHVLEAMGGAAERTHAWLAQEPPPPDIAPLNLVAIEVVADAAARIIPLSSGLPDACFDHDGQITKQEIRAMTLAALAPARGELLWDVGAGSGSVAIEWMLRHPSNRAIAIERDPTRAARARANATDLGVPDLRVVAGTAPAAMDGLPAPDAVFIGGGASADTIAIAWRTLKPGGRIVVNSVTLETESLLATVLRDHGGTLTRIAIERLDRVGTKQAFRPAMTVTQWCARR